MESVNKRCESMLGAKISVKWETISAVFGWIFILMFNKTIYSCTCSERHCNNKFDVKFRCVTVDVIIYL